MPTIENTERVVLNILTSEQYAQQQSQGQINDNQLYGVTDSKDDAINITYSNAQSNLTATNVQEAIDKIASDVVGLPKIFNGTNSIDNLKINGVTKLLKEYLEALNPINENVAYVRVGTDGDGSFLMPYNNLTSAFNALSVTKNTINMLGVNSYTLPTNVDTTNLLRFVGLETDISGDITLSKDNAIYHIVNHTGDIIINGNDITVLVDGALIGDLTIVGERARAMVNFFDTAKTITGEVNIVGGSKVGRFVYDQV